MSQVDEWFIPLKRTEDPYIRLFCFHYGGGSASAYRQWASDLVDNVDLIAVQLPGRESRFNEPLLDNIFEVVGELHKYFSYYANKPFVFFGHSIGALIAFEFARELRKRSLLLPKHLIASATKAPQVPLKKEILHHLPDEMLKEKLRDYNGIPIDILENQELMSIFLPIIRADFAISENYKYLNDEPLICPITVFGGLSDDTFAREDLLEWQKQTTADFEYELFKGDHFFIKSSYKEVIARVNKILYSYVAKCVTLH